jgi:hypothetical protein
MRKYRTIDETTSENNQETPATAVDSWLFSIAKFEEEVASGENSEGEADTDSEHTIEEEFTTYIMSLPKRGVALDAVKFWEVGYCQTLP